MTSPEPSELMVRAVSLYLPILLTIALALHARPSRRRVAGAMLATAWNVSALLAVNLVAVRVGWWTFDAGAPTVLGFPADLWIGWALLWGAVPILATTNRLLMVGIALVAADLVLMPLAGPVVRLHATWLVGETLAVATCLVPGLLLGRWTADGTQLGRRAFLQVAAFTGLLFFVLPSVIFAVTGGDWAPLLDRPRWQFVLVGVLVAPVAAMALQAVREFVAHGGTPVPLDPPLEPGHDRAVRLPRQPDAARRHHPPGGVGRPAGESRSSGGGTHGRRCSAPAWRRGVRTTISSAGSATSGVGTAGGPGSGCRRGDRRSSCPASSGPRPGASRAAMSGGSSTAGLPSGSRYDRPSSARIACNGSPIGGGPSWSPAWLPSAGASSTSTWPGRA